MGADMNVNLIPNVPTTKLVEILNAEIRVSTSVANMLHVKSVLSNITNYQYFSHFNLTFFHNWTLFNCPFR